VPRAGLDRERLVGEAAAIADTEGLENVTLARLASRLNVKAPSLYNHVDGLDELRRALKLHALNEQANALREAAVGRSGPDALRALARALRAFAREHPGLHAATRVSTVGESEELAAASDAVLHVVFAVLRGYGLEGNALVHATRSLRAAIGGFVELELDGGFGMPQDVEESFEWLVNVLDRGLREAADGPGA
jgi:AcrR family transcriptional regulator